MRIVASSPVPRALIFDLDKTLYSQDDYASFQEAALIERLGRELGIGTQGAVARLDALMAKRAAAGSGKTSLGNLFQDLGFDIATSVKWREEAYDPRDWLTADPALDKALAELCCRFRLALVTNNPCKIGEASLEALGVKARFSAIVGLDTTMASKPSPEPFIRAAALLDAHPRECISIGDRYDVDIVPAVELGMGAILVSGVGDVYRLPEILR
jgi:FMN phosphatase YigB (HAD superfamily)